MINIYVSRDINKNKVLFEKIKENLSNNIKSYYFVPDQYTLFSDINLIESLETDVLMDVKVKSFSSYSDEILSSYGGIKKKVLTENGKNMLVKKILLSLEDEFNVFDKNINNKGFVSEVSKTISELKDSGISVDDFRSAINNLDNVNKAKLEDMAKLYEAYHIAIKGEYIDSNDKLNLLYEKLDMANDLNEREFFFDKYNSLNSQELAIIEKLNNMSCKINFFLIMDPRLINAGSTDEVEAGELFESTFYLYNKLKSFANDINVIKLEDNLKSEQSFLANNIFSYNASSTNKKTDHICLIKCKNTEDEINFLCEIIKKHIIEKQYNYNDFTIITTNEDEYNKYIRKIFTGEGIPFFIDTNEHLLDNNLANFLINSLLLIVKNFRQEDICSFLKFGFSYINMEDLEMFEEYIITRKIKGYKIFEDFYFSFDNEYLNTLSNEDKEIQLKKLQASNRVRNEFIDIIYKYYENSKKDGSINDHIKNYFSFLYSDKVKESLKEFLDSQKEDERLASYNEQTWNYFIDTINELADIQGEDITSFKNFANILISGFEERNIGLIPPYQDGVFVGSSQRTRTNNSKIIFIVGLVDNYFPTKINPTSIIDDKERSMLNENGLEILLKEPLFRSEEYMNFYSNILKSEEHLYISSSLMDSENTSLYESLYYRQAENILRNVRKINEGEFFSNIKYSKSLLVKSLINNLENKLENPGLLKEKDIRLFNYLYHNKDKNILSALDMLKPRVKNLENYNDIYGTNKLSVSRIQTYGRCPYKHYVRYGLSPSENIQYDLERREVGNIAHSTLSEFINRYKNKPKYYESINEEDFKEEIYEIMDRDASISIDEKRLADNKNRILLGLAKDNLYTGIKNVKRQLSLSSFTPRETEARFGENSNIPSLKIQVGDRIVELEGIIDRIDSYRTDDSENIIVIDYKTGSKSFDLSFAVNGLDVQLPIYLYATTEARPNYRGAGFFYLPIKDQFINSEEENQEEIIGKLVDSLRLDGVVIRDREILQAIDEDIDSNSTVIRFKGHVNKNPELRDNVLSERSLNKLVEDVLDVTRENIEGIFTGNIRTNPYIFEQKSECTNCDFKNICKFDFEKNKTYRPIAKIDWSDYKDE